MQAQLVPMQRLLPEDRAGMYALLNQHFVGVRPEVFAADLQQKNWVLLLKQGETLQGFSTLHFYETTFEGEAIAVVYSGDTIVDPAAWTSSTLPKAWIQAIDSLHRAHPTRKLYWLLICSGFRTYRFLPVFWQEFYPRYDRPTPPRAQALLDQLIAVEAGSDYDPARGIVRFSHPHQLRDRLQGIPAERQNDPHIQFFAQRNPGHAAGDELVCLTEIHPDNLTRAGRRVWPVESLCLTA